MNEQVLNEVVNSQTAGVPVVKADVLPKNIKPVTTPTNVAPVTSTPTPVSAPVREGEPVVTEKTKSTPVANVNQDVTKGLYV